MTNESETKACLEYLISQGLVEKRGEYYGLSAKGRALAEQQKSTDTLTLPQPGRDYGHS